MIKSQLTAVLAKKFTQLPEKQVAEAVNQILTIMTHSLKEGNRIEVRRFGSFSLNYHGERHAHNPKTGIKVVTKEKYSPHFKPGKELRARVNASRVKFPIRKKEEKE